MNFATVRIENEWQDKRLHPLLRVLVQEAQEYAQSRWGWRFFVTCIFRTKEEDDALEGTGIHTAWRAIDIRTRNIDRDAVQDLTDHINDNWIYDPKRPSLVVLYAKPHGSGPHAHFQVHPNTMRRM